MYALLTYKKSKNISRQKFGCYPVAIAHVTPVYEILINDENAMLKYANRLDLNIVKYYDAFKRLYQFTRITKYRDFEYQFLLGKIICNIDLKAWGIKDSDICTFCEEEQESMIHLFWECRYVLPYGDI